MKTREEVRTGQIETLAAAAHSVAARYRFPRKTMGRKPVVKPAVIHESWFHRDNQGEQK